MARTTTENLSEDIQKMKLVMGEIRADLAMMKSDFRWMAATIEEMRADVRSFARWMFVFSFILNAFFAFVTFCFLTNFRWLTTHSHF